MHTTVTHADGTVATVRNLGWLEHHRQDVEIIILYGAGGMTVITNRGDIYRIDWADISVRDKYLSTRFQGVERVKADHDYEEWRDLIVIPSTTILVGFADDGMAQVFPALFEKLGPISGLKMSSPTDNSDDYFRWLLHFPDLKHAIKFRNAFYAIFADLPVQVGFSYIHLNSMPYIGLDMPNEVKLAFQATIDRARTDANLPAFDWTF